MFSLGRIPESSKGFALLKFCLKLSLFTHSKFLPLEMKSNHTNQKKVRISAELCSHFDHVLSLVKKFLEEAWWMRNGAWQKANVVAFIFSFKQVGV